MNHSQDVLHVEEIQSVINETHRGDRDQEILDSWRRCIQVHELNPFERRSAYILPEENLREHVDEAEDLLRTARFGLETLYQEIVGHNYVVLLTNSQGVTLDYLCDPDKESDFRKAGLYLGAEWLEEKVGTRFTKQIISMLLISHLPAQQLQSMILLVIWRLYLTSQLYKLPDQKTRNHLLNN
jgi:transcriptional regulator of acetoin/glycerol metabolism